MSFEDMAGLVGRGLEGAGILAMIVGIAFSLVRYARQMSAADAYHQLRRGIGHAILLGLELLVAADIINTVSHEVTFQTVGTLAVIVAIRTFLGFALQIELEGRVPWRRHKE